MQPLVTRGESFASNADDASRTILVIHSYPPDLPWVRAFNAGLKAAATPDERLVFEYLNRPDVDADIAGDRAFLSQLEARYGAPGAVDGIITDSQPIDELLNDNPQPWMRSLPLIGNGDTPPGWAENALSLAHGLEFSKQADLMKALFPNRQAALLCDGQNPQSVSWCDDMAAELAARFGAVRRIHFDFDAIGSHAQVRALPANSVVFALPIFQDFEGESDVPARVLSNIANETGVPIFTAWSTMLGDGIIGGYVRAGEEFGRHALLALRDVLDDKAPARPTVAPQLTIDFRALTRFGIDVAALPAGATVLFEPLPVWEAYPRETIAAVLAGLVLLTISLGLLTLLRQRNGLIRRAFDAERALSVTNADLERRIAERTADLRALAQDHEEARRLATAANEAKTAFLASMNHELRTPLNAIIGFADFLATMPRALAVDRMEDYALLIRDSGHQLKRLIDDLVDIAHAHDEPAAVQLETVDLRTQVAACMTMVRSLDNVGADRLEALPDGPPIEAQADPQRLRQIVLNLLINALKYNTPTGRVWISLDTVGTEFVTIAVHDTGFGVPLEKRDKLFQLFTRLHSDTEPHVKGMGIGLALSQRLAQAMGGMIEYAPRPGGGSIFTVSLPRASVQLASLVG